MTWSLHLVLGMLNASLVESWVPQSLVPQSLVPQSLVPQAVVLQSLVPQAVVLQSLVPQSLHCLVPQLNWHAALVDHARPP